MKCIIHCKDVIARFLHNIKFWLKKKTYILKMLFLPLMIINKPSVYIKNTRNNKELFLTNVLGRKEVFYLTTHLTHFIYGYMASDKW